MTVDPHLGMDHLSFVIFTDPIFFSHMPLPQRATCHILSGHKRISLAFWEANTRVTCGGTFWKVVLQAVSRSGWERKGRLESSGARRWLFMQIWLGGQIWKRWEKVFVIRGVFALRKGREKGGEDILAEVRCFWRVGCFFSRSAMIFWGGAFFLKGKPGKIGKWETE